MQTGFTFKRHQRLTTATEFKAVFTQPYKSIDAYFTLLAIPNHLNYGRLGLAIAKKQVRLAVNRNRIKRIVRESFRLHQHQLIGLDIVALARNRTAQANNHHLFNSLTQHWQKLSLHYKNSLSSSSEVTS